MKETLTTRTQPELKPSLIESKIESTSPTPPNNAAIPADLFNQNIKKEKDITPKAVFLPETASFLGNCGIQTEYVNPVPFAKGANHTVLWYFPPGEVEKVIKIPNKLAPLSQNEKEEERSIEIITKAFDKFTLPTEIRIDKTTGKYCVIQQAVKGKTITNKNYQEGSIMSQLEEIVKFNHQLYQEKGISFDFIGMPGFLTWLKKQFGKLFVGKSEIEVSNLIIDKKDGIIKIIDYDLLEHKGNVSFKKKIVSWLGFTINRILMKHYFKLDIKKPK